MMRKTNTGLFKCLNIIFGLIDKIIFYNLTIEPEICSSTRNRLKLKDYQTSYLNFKKKFFQNLNFVLNPVERGRKLYQFSPSFMKHDGVGNLGVFLDKKFQKKGFITKMFAIDFNKELYRNISDITEFKNDLKPKDIVVLHYTGDSEINNIAANLKCEKWFFYHNVTPSHYFKNYNRDIYELTLKGREKLFSYKDKFNKSVTWSEFNADELRTIGFKNVNVEPLPKDFNMLDSEVDNDLYEKYNDGYFNIIFVGRILPYKNYKFLIDCYNEFKTKFCPKSRLLLPGVFDDTKYKEEIDNFIVLNKINDIVFFGRIEQNKLNALYKVSNLFLCVSGHEGYCMPIIEAMYFGIPIIALNNGAVKETVSCGGIILDSNTDKKNIANEIYNIYSSEKLKNKFLLNQKKILLDRYFNYDFND
ncbi:glycosyltransferase [Candidatus Dependentiae bacterium]|nr:glycosyltransferase [Candidatus Dependentiae bacterium]